MVRQGDLARHAHQVGLVAIQQSGTDGGVGFHDGPFVGLELARLEQDGVGDTDLADVVHRAGIQDQVTLCLAPVQGPGQHGTDVAHPQDVVAGFLVPVLGGFAQTLDHLQPGAAQLFGLHPHHGVQGGGLVVQESVRQMHIQQVAHPHQQLGAVERLGQVVAGPGTQGFKQVLLAMLGRQDHDRWQQGRPQGLELLHDLKAIQVRHVQVEQDEVGLCVLIQADHPARVFHQHQLLIALHAQHLVEQLQVDWFVVHGHDAFAPRCSV